MGSTIQMILPVFCNNPGNIKMYTLYVNELIYFSELVSNLYITIDGNCFLFFLI